MRNPESSKNATEGFKHPLHFKLKKMYEPKRLKALRTAVVVFMALMAYQFWLGMTVNLESALPVKHLPVFSALSYYYNNFLFLRAHIINAILILGVAIMFLYISTRLRAKSFLVVAIVGLISITGGIINGLMFLASGQFFGYSIGMAMSAVAAIITYSAGLYYIGIHYGQYVRS